MVSRHLKPGYGHLEQVEIDYQPRCNDGPIPPRLALWWSSLADATNRADRPLAFNPNTVHMLRSQGFVDVEETVIRMPFNTWPSSNHEKDIGRWHNVGLREGLEAMSLGPFFRVFKWSADHIRKLCREVEAEINDKRYHVYNNL